MKTIIIQPYLTQWRTVKGLTQTEVAKRAGVSKSAISRIESGERCVDIDWLNAYAKALRLDNAVRLFEYPYKA